MALSLASGLKEYQKRLEGLWGKKKTSWCSASLGRAETPSHMKWSVGKRRCWELLTAFAGEVSIVFVAYAVTTVRSGMTVFLFFSLQLLHLLPQIFGCFWWWWKSGRSIKWSGMGTSLFPKQISDPISLIFKELPVCITGLPFQCMPRCFFFFDRFVDIWCDQWVFRFDVRYLLAGYHSSDSS